MANDVIFARTRYDYPPYEDLHQLVTLSGYPLVYVDEIPRDGVRDKTYIVTPVNGEWNSGIQTDARIIHWQLEWNLDGEHHTPPGVAETWTMDGWQAQRFGFRHVMIGSHPDLAWQSDEKMTCAEIHDVAFLAYMTNRRLATAHKLREANLRVSIASAWGKERDLILACSRAYLHIHQHDDAPGVPGLRVAMAAAYKLPFFTEICAAPGEIEPFILQAPYGEVASTIKHWLNMPTALENYAEDLHEYLCFNRTFKACVEAAL